MSAHGWLSVTVVLGCVSLLGAGRLAPELVLFAGLVVLLAAGAVTPAEALAGFANEGLMTVAMMYVVAAGLRETGAIDFLVHHVLGRPRTPRGRLARLVAPVTVMSAFLNNTPIVATFIPAVLDWARRLRTPPSLLLLPLSYAAILGGTCTVIGTSTNLVVNGLLIAEFGGPGLALFEIAWVGVPCALAGVGFLLLFGPRALPERTPAAAAFGDPREYTVEMTVDPDGPLVGKTVEQAELRHLKDVYLLEIERGSHLVPATGPHERLGPGDRLVFAAGADSVLELQRIRGLTLSTDRAFSLEDRLPERRLVEVVLSRQCAAVGKTLPESRFRTLYGAAVLAIARNGHRIRGRVGRVRLRPSDTLLLEVRPSFLERHRNSRDFLLVNVLGESMPVRHHRASLAWGILLGVVVAATTGVASMLVASMVGAALMVITGCCSASAARRSLDVQVLLAIAASFGLGKALQATGAAGVIAHGFLDLAGGHPWLLLAGTYLLTSVLTELVTNNAVAVLMFPIVVAAAEALGLSPMPFVIAVMMAASASFATPIGYQTNLMVYGPGGYRLGDYLRLGIPMNLVVGVVTVTLTPLVWPFQG